MIRRLIILLLIVGCVFAQDEFIPMLNTKINIDKEELKDNKIDKIYHSNIVGDSLKIKPRKILSFRIGWEIGGKKFTEPEILRILWENPYTNYELTHYKAKRQYTDKIQKLAWMIIIGSISVNWGVDKKYLPPLIYINDDAHYRIGFPSLLISWRMYYHEQKHIIKAVQIYNGEATYTSHNPFININ